MNRDTYKQFKKRTPLVKDNKWAFMTSFFETAQIKDIFFASCILVLGTLLAFSIKRISYRILSRRSQSSTHSLFNLFSTQQIYRFTVVISSLLFWVTLIYSLSLAAKPLGINFLEGFGKKILSYFPTFLTSAFILFIGFSFARMSRRFINQSSLALESNSGKNLSKIVYIILVSITILIAMDQLGVDIKFLTSTVLVLLGCLLGGVAISFGMGSASLVTSILASYYLKKVLKIGQTVEGDGFLGRVVEINSTSILIQTKSGIDVIPAKQMNNNRFRIVNV